MVKYKVKEVIRVSSNRKTVDLHDIMKFPHVSG